MTVTLKLEFSDRYEDALDRRLDQLVEERLDEVTGGTGSTWDRQREKLSVDESTVPDKADYVSQLIREDLAEAGLKPRNRGSDDE